jgi:hypothetical protein
MGRDELQKLKNLAAERAVTLNDILLRDMIVTVDRWNRAHGFGRSGACRINVPVYVRGRGGAEIPASNGIGFAFVTLDPAKFADGAALLTAVHEQMEQIKKWKLALYFLGGVAIASRVRPLLSWALRRKKSFATVVLSYLGPALAHSPLPRQDGRLICGNVVLMGIAGVPPVRPLTLGAMVVVEYAGELVVSLRCDPRGFRPVDTRALLDEYVAALTETARGQG